MTHPIVKGACGRTGWIHLAGWMVFAAMMTAKRNRVAKQKKSWMRHHETRVGRSRKLTCEMVERIWGLG